MRVAILASGSGSNAAALMNHFSNTEGIDVVLVGSNRSSSGVLEKANQAGVASLHFSREELDSGELLKKLETLKVDWVLLAGFLLKIPKEFCRAFENKILNIHPSLLPKFGGEGMYGMNVHRAVFEAEEKESGMTIHYVNERYDEGAIVFQGRIDVSELKSAEEIASEVLKLEHEYYPRVAREVILDSERNIK
ncbi:MAG TPA: phosphoribosylglycinamide formyltransferase [Flavobacteriales bacterium]|nr:phosphoribosylglycinamide formyltransferase [Flavobacteriales bacterium]